MLHQEEVIPLIAIVSWLASLDDFGHLGTIQSPYTYRLNDDTTPVRRRKN